MMIPFIPLESPILYPPVGRCIYCDDPPGELTDEHILGRAFGGNRVLPKSSCERCRRVTQRIEKVCAGQMFGDYRVRIGGPTQSRRGWPTDLRLHGTLANGEERVAVVPPEDHPGAFAMFELPPPSILTGNIEDELKYSPKIFIADPEALRRIPSEMQTARIRLAVWVESAFLRMLAKIVHGALIAEVGLSDQLEYFLPAVIHGDHLRIRKFIGGYNNVQRSNIPNIGWHYLIINSVEKDGDIFYVAHVCLYAYQMTPVYIVVAAVSRGLSHKNDKTRSCGDFLNPSTVAVPIQLPHNFRSQS